MWKPPRNPRIKFLRTRFKKEYIRQEHHRHSAIIKKDLYLAKCIIQHLRDWHKYAKVQNKTLMPAYANYTLDLMTWANNRIKKTIERNKKFYYNSTLRPEPFEDYEIAAMYVAMRVEGNSQGGDAVPFTCVNEQFIVVLNLSSKLAF